METRPILRGLRRDWWVAMGLLAGLAALLALVLRDYGVGLPEFPTTTTESHPALSPIVTGAFERLFETGAVMQLNRLTNGASPFHTTYFQPTKPKPPTTRKVTMTYLGYVESTAGQRRAFLLLDNDTKVGALGGAVVGDLSVAEMTLRTLTLTNSAAETNLLEFNVSKTVEVPAP
jgi:hypothetical protein